MKKEFIYFVQLVGIEAVKIGKTSGESINQRINQLSVSAPLGIEVLGFFETNNSIEKERQLHHRFAAHRLKGEWFKITKEHVQMVLQDENVTHDDFLLKVKAWLESGGQKKVIEKIINNESINIDHPDSNLLIDLQDFIKSINNNPEQYSINDFHKELKRYNKKFNDISLNKLGFLMTKLNYQSRTIKNNGLVQRRYYKRLV
jgi:hypothetical protein